MATWVVVHVIHTRVPYQYTPKLVITNVPDDIRITTSLLERAGFQYGEFGVNWANHRILRIGPNTPSSLIARLRTGAGRWISYNELIRLASEPL